MNPDFLNYLLQIPIREELPSVEEITTLLKLEGEKLKQLYLAADQVREKYLGSAVLVRGILEFSNYCQLNCRYCGIRNANRKVSRYRIEETEILAVAKTATSYGCSTLVLQSGEDKIYDIDRICDLLKRIKETADVAITLSIGEGSSKEYQKLKEAGCDRFLLRFETSNRKIFKQLHPDDNFDRRINCLRNIRRAGIQLGSGFMIGLPNGDLTTLATDIKFASELKLDMIGCGPFVAHPDTPLKGQGLQLELEVYFKTIAILRLLNPYSHIPATTAFDVITPNGREALLNRGCNVYMPNLTPQIYRKNYQLYRDKPDVDGNTDLSWLKALKRIKKTGKQISSSKGHSRQPAWKQQEK